MKHRLALVLSLVLAAPAAPVVAQEEGDGRSLMEEGLHLFMDGLRREMEPAMDDLRDFAERAGPSMRSFFQEMGPALAEMMDEVQDWTRYFPPEMLPNGDIILRRRPEPEPGPEPEAEPETDAQPPAGPTDI
ncbi:hypothetical protein [Antarcticimicrobium luteum]|uniref:AAA+ family ATPase n=1 Tax=Antarcticimicrobium luteum TaxID=2547397 RepID=A0A4R5UQ60_9RHOB|nr:hypothetical protein [Antarcticimicrobium luteum]TDK41045.1 hypothetical protein E1832_20295 [Antarcticimicrobium luteum]